MNEKRVYTFGNGQAEGNASMREVLGGKGANLAEMNHIGVPVPPGFTITTDTCNEYYKLGQEKIVKLLTDEVNAAVAHTEKLMNCKFGDPKNPLLVSVRSGARASMPGMMDTILNLGLNDEVAAGMVEKTGNPHFVYDSYRRFVQMYGDVVLGMKPENKEDIDPFEAIIEKVKQEQGVVLDKDLSVESLKKLVELFKKAIKEQTGSDFPTDPKEQLWGAICAVFRSWMNERAILYRKMEGIPDEWGTAVSVMAMVFGNMGETSATGVCFSRDAGNGENLFNGEYLINAQGEDVVAGIRTPQQITKIGSQRWAERAGISEEERATNYPSMEEAMPELYKELDALQDKLEKHYRDMQDMEFTVQEGKLWFLQTRNGKRTGTAMVKIAMDLLHEGMIDEKTAILRCEPQKLDELLHPVFDKLALSKAKVITQGLPASPGAACGQIVFHADDAEAWHEDGKKVIMVRIETSPEDLAGMSAAEGILTARGGMTSHAAVVARGMGKCCVSGAGSINVDYKTKTVEIEGVVYKEGDFISLNGTTGQVYAGQIETKAAELSGDFKELMNLCDKYTKMEIRTNADTPHDAKVARQFGAKGIGLTRTEHMFFDDQKIVAMREMILADSVEGREKALAKLLPYQKADFYGILKAMDGCHVNIRLLDPPLHEFVPHDKAGQETMAKEMGVSV
ncbi:pyruvate, phosphate dikinase, partial [Prevotella sp.]